LSLQSPVDGFLAGLNQGFIRARKWLRSEKAPARRQRRGMRGSDNGGIRKKARGGLGIFAPQDRDELGAIQGADSGFGDFFPAHFAMRAVISGFDGEHAVQKHDALGTPGSEVSVGATGGAECYT